VAKHRQKPMQPASVAPPPVTPAPENSSHHAFALKHRFFDEVRRRNVVRVGVLYLIACWVILEPTHVVFHMLEVPEWANRLVIILMVIGFPLVLLFSWVYEVTPEGLKLTSEVDPARSTTRETGRRLDRAIIVVLSIAVVLLLADRFWLLRNSAPSKQEQASSKHTTAASTTVPSSRDSPSAKAVPVDDKSIAVLPFVNMSADKEQDYFSDGLSEELIDRLSHSPDLRVIARTSCFYFKGKQATVGEIAGTLHVSYVLEGSVRKSGKALRITAQLVRAADSTHVWSQTYDRNLSDIFKVQDEIARTVAQALKVVLGSGDDRTRSKDTSPEAYNLLLQGNFFFDRTAKPDSYRAIELYKRAIGLDPNYALAWAKLAGVHEQQAFYAWGSILEGEAKARDAAERALRLNPDLAMAQRVLGDLFLTLDWDWKAAKARFERAHELEPDGFEVAQGLAWVNGGIYGRLGESIEIDRKQISRDPLDTRTLSNLGLLLFFAGRLEEAVAAQQRVVLLNPSRADAHAFLAYELLYLGRPDEALAAAQAEPDEPWRLQSLPIVLWALGRKAESDAALRELEAKYAAGSSYNIAEAHAYRGEIDSAFRWLDRAYRQHDGGMTWIRIDPLLQNLRQDQRYQAWLVKMNLDGDPPVHSR
jgi:adenylate cyclase